MNYQIKVPTKKEYEEVMEIWNNKLGVYALIKNYWDKYKENTKLFLDIDVKYWCYGYTCDRRYTEITIEKLKDILEPNKNIKVGDKVVVNGEEIFCNSVGVVVVRDESGALPYLIDFKGDVIETHNNLHTGFRNLSTNTGYWLSGDKLTLFNEPIVDKSEEPMDTRKEDTLIVELYKPMYFVDHVAKDVNCVVKLSDNELKVGFSKASYSDKFDVEFGKQVAYRRAMGDTKAAESLIADKYNSTNWSKVEKGTLVTVGKSEIFYLFEKFGEESGDLYVKSSKGNVYCFKRHQVTLYKA